MKKLWEITATIDYRNQEVQRMKPIRLLECDLIEKCGRDVQDLWGKDCLDWSLLCNLGKDPGYCTRNMGTHMEKKRQRYQDKNCHAWYVSLKVSKMQGYTNRSTNMCRWANVIHLNAAPIIVLTTHPVSINCQSIDKSDKENMWAKRLSFPNLSCVKQKLPGLPPEMWVVTYPPSSVSHCRRASTRPSSLTKQVQPH